MLISIPVPNLINGVSQQDPSLRQASQCDLQENAFPSVVAGLCKRPPTVHLANLCDAPEGSLFCHTIERDANEKYIVLIFDGNIKVFDLRNGVEKAVNFSEGSAYLSGSDYRAATIADHTFITNQNVVTAMSTEADADVPPKALVTVKQGNYTTDYKVTLDGTHEALYTTSETDTDTLKTDYICEKLAKKLSAFDGFTVERSGNSLSVCKDDDSDFDIKVSDSYGGNALSVAKESIQRFSDLPSVAPEGFIVEIQGDQSSSFDNYFVKFKSDNADDNFSHGVWVECQAPGLVNNIDNSTMPHCLVREADGSFTFKPMEWEPRKVGDADGAQEPPFIGNKITSVFFYKNRLGFLSDDTVSMSQAAEYFNFWAETMTDVLDSDPIHVSAAFARVAKLNHAVPWNQKLLLFSDQDQYILEGSDILTQKTVSISQSTAFGSSAICQPIGAGRNVFFATKQGSYSGVREYYIQYDTEVTDAAEVTGHVPKYIRGDILQFAGSSLADMVCCITDATPDTVYVYNYMWGGTGQSQKVQSCWSKFILPGCSIKSIAFVGTKLYMALVRNGQLQLEAMDIADITDHTQEAFLDARLDNQSVTIEYDEDAEETVLTLPYKPSESFVVYTEAYNQMTVNSIQDNQVRVRQDLRTLNFYAGEPYKFRYRFSQVIPRRDGKLVMNDGVLIVRELKLAYGESGPFEVLIKPKWGQEFVQKFTAWHLGSAETLIGESPVHEDEVRIGINQKAPEVTVELISDNPFPSRFIYANWQAFWGGLGRK